MDKFNPTKTEDKVTKFWSGSSIYEKTKKARAKGKKFYFNDGPPYTTGSIHLGTAWNKVLKDSILRYKRMQNYNVHDQAGWDMHGLPIEVTLEKKLGIRNKQEILEKFGMERFIKECRKFALENLDKMTGQFKRLGVWLDWENPYRTIDNSYIEGAWWALKKAHDKNLLYIGPRSTTWCARCATALAKHELEYKTVKEKSVFVKFQLEGKKNEYILIWTTTPWTLPSNVMVAVHPDLDYVKVKVENETWILAKQMVHALMGVLGKKYEIVETFKGEKLHGIGYVHPFLEEIPLQKELKNKEEFAHKIVAVGDDIFYGFVTTTAGTGCVHTAPGAGAEDFEVGTHFKVSALCLIDENGVFTKQGGKYAGFKAKKDDSKIVNDLKTKGVLLLESDVDHEYAHCWRCNSPVLYRATPQWYLKVTEFKEKMLAENKKIKWGPDWAGSRWFRDWLENIQDWCISRQRFWGIPLPIWKCKNGHIKVIGSKKELGQKIQDLHKPWIDKIKLKCDKCKEEMTRVPDIFDVWLESGAATWASLKFPNTDKEFKEWWPADFITEGKDQIRAWFYSQLALSMLSHGKPPYKSVYMHGFVADDKGMKMSKSLGNIVSPDQVIEKVGADGWRWYCLGASNPGEDLRFNWKDLDESYRALNILWNTATFLEYMKLEKFNPEKYKLDVKKLKAEDKWMLSKVNTLNEQVTRAFEDFKFPIVPNLLQEFLVEDLSRWYVKLIRNRTWVAVKGDDKFIAFKVLYEVLKTFLTLSAPIIPYHTEEIYQNLVRPLNKNSRESVHMLDWPKPDKAMRKAELEQGMEIVKKAVESSRFAREEAGIKLRWPLRALAIDGDSNVKKAVETFKKVLLEQANVKAVKFGKSKGTCKKFEFGKIYLDTELTPDILEEALAREVMRAVQVLRKKNGLNVGEKISLSVKSDDPSIQKTLQKYKKEIVHKVGAKEIEIGTLKGKAKDKFDFKGKKIEIGFDKIGPVA